MPEAKFTWFPKLTATVAKVPEEQRGAILWALAQYGTYGVEPALEWPLDAIFESLREDIDNSKRAISSGGTGGRGNKKGASSDSKGPFANGETSLCECQNPACDHVETGVSETENGGSGDAEPKPSHTKPNHTKPSHTNPKKVFVPPSVDEVRAHCAEKGYTFDPEAFVAFYESKGWKVGRNPMKSWQAACTTWQKRQEGRKEASHDEYSDL